MNSLILYSLYIYITNIGTLLLTNWHVTGNIACLSYFNKFLVLFNNNIPVLLNKCIPTIYGVTRSMILLPLLLEEKIIFDHRPQSI